MDSLERGTVVSVSGNRAEVLLQGEKVLNRSAMLCPNGTQEGDIVVVAKVNGGYMVLQNYSKG